jgi:hypothetical protein
MNCVVVCDGWVLGVGGTWSSAVSVQNTLWCGEPVFFFGLLLLVDASVVQVGLELSKCFGKSERSRGGM